MEKQIVGIVSDAPQDNGLGEYFVSREKRRQFDLKRLLENIVGMRFGYLTVVGAEPPSEKGTRETICHCVCDCGNSRDVTMGELIAPKGVKSCGLGKKCSCRVYKKKELIFTKEQLLELYIEKNLSTREVAAILGTTEGPLRRHLKAYGIEKSSEKIIESIAHTKEEKEKAKPSKPPKVTSWVIYKHTSPDGKCYIGQTRKLGRRWSVKSGSGYEHNTKFCEAIQRFGWKNFIHEILEDNILTQEEALEREEYWIAFYDSYRNGYNGNPGGKNGYIEKRPIYQIEPDTKRIINKFDSLMDAVRATGISAPCISQCCSRIIQTAGKYCWCYVDEFSDDWEMPKSSVRRGRRIVCIETGEVFHSPQELEKIIGVHHSQITRVCGCEKYKWRPIKGKHYCYLGEEKDFVPAQNMNYRRVRCVETGEEYPSYRVASEKTGISYSSIKGCINGKNKSAGGYHWEAISPPKNKNKERN